jgi:DHA2 family multidrug resistance protein
MLLPLDKVRMGAGLINILQQGIGGTVGLAMMTTLLERRTTSHASLLEQQQVFSPVAWEEILAPVRDQVQRTGEVGALGDVQALALLRQHLEQQATVAAYQDCFVLVAMLCVVVMPLVLFLRRQPAE